MELPPLPRDLRIQRSADVEDVTARLFAQGVGDGHPVIPPTSDRVEAMLGSLDGERSLGQLPPLRREVRVRDIAVCAVMAGCPPEAMAPLVAAIGAVQADEFNLLGLTTTTGSAAVGMVLHGDVIDAVGANAGANCLGPGNVANASIGRALATVIRVVGGAMPGTIDVAINGQPAKYGLCFGELPASEGWPGLHEERGLPSSPGAVTVLGVAGTVEVVDTTSQSLEDLMDTLAGSLLLPISSASDGSALGCGEPVVIIPPEWVTRLRHEGWTRERVREHLWEKARVPLDQLAPGMRARANESAREAGELRAAHAPESVTILVAGGPGTKATLLPLWPGSSRTVTVPV